MATTPAAEKRADGHEPPEAKQPQSGVGHLPHVWMPHVPAPQVSMPSGTAGRVLWWGGLAAVAAFGVVDWPVAALVAAGSWVAEQHAKQGQRARGEHPEAGHATKA